MLSLRAQRSNLVPQVALSQVSPRIRMTIPQRKTFASFAPPRLYVGFNSFSVSSVAS